MSSNAQLSNTATGHAAFSCVPLLFVVVICWGHVVR